MKVSVSFLSIKEPIQENIKKLDQQNIDFLHVDMMDGKFVKNKKYSKEELEVLLKDHQKPLDIHLMVKDVKRYMDEIYDLSPTYVTFHYEAIPNVLEMIEYGKSLGYQIGLSIKPSIPISKIKDYLPILDLVLVMSVEPGAGGQTFLKDMVQKLDELAQLKEENSYSYLTSIDGGINQETAPLCKKADILVSGSYITNQEDYQKNINILKEIDKQ